MHSTQKSIENNLSNNMYILLFSNITRETKLSILLSSMYRRNYKILLTHSTKLNNS
uniref:Uncharacterized protein n=1 Tax=Solanum lycopersicum TaxID=4081 RepID=A0A3Q7IAC2_SOLLC